MRLQVASQLAIFAILELAKDPERQLSVVEIGEKHDVSSHHLAKVMHVLGRAGLVRSVRGAGGGYQISGNIRRITMLDVVQLFENLSAADDAPARTAEERALNRVLGEIDDIARATLGSITIATMLKLVEHERAAAALKSRRA